MTETEALKKRIAVLEKRLIELFDEQSESRKKFQLISKVLDEMAKRNSEEGEIIQKLGKALAS